MSVLTGNDKADELKMGRGHVSQIKELKKMFASLVAKVHREFEIHVSNLVENTAADIPSVAVWLNEILRGTQDEPLAIEVNVGSYDDLFRALQHKWSFTRPTFLRQLTEIIENEALSQQMKEYTSEYDFFCNSLELKEEVSLEFLDPTNPCLVLTFESGTTFEDVEVFLKEAFSIYKRYLRVHKIEPGSVKVILQFPAKIKPLLQACIDQKRAASKQYKVKHMQIQASPPEPDFTEGELYAATSDGFNASPIVILFLAILIAVAFIKCMY